MIQLAFWLMINIEPFNSTEKSNLTDSNFHVKNNETALDSLYLFLGVNFP